MVAAAARRPRMAGEHKMGFLEADATAAAVMDLPTHARYPEKAFCRFAVSLKTGLWSAWNLT